MTLITFAVENKIRKTKTIYRYATRIKMIANAIDAVIKVQGLFLKATKVGSTNVSDPAAYVSTERHVYLSYIFH